jgi:hypothetical protein
VRDAHKSYVKSTALPKELVQRIAKLETDAYVVSGWGQYSQGPGGVAAKGLGQGMGVN